MTLSAAAARTMRQRRRALDLTQQQLADAIGWERAAVGFVEQGRRKLQLDDVPRVCAALGLTMAELVAGAEDAGPLGL